MNPNKNIYKITEGIVIQKYDMKLKRFVNQEFIRSRPEFYENDEREIFINDNSSTELKLVRDTVLPIKLVQPKRRVKYR